jgi:hypothetical protein
VYFALVEDMISNRLAVLLPPPLFRRIQLQRGVFLKTGGRIAKSLFHRIEFPIDGRFQVARAGEYIDLLPEPEWVHLARRFINQLPTSSLDLSGEELERAWWSDDLKTLMLRPPAFDPDEEVMRWVDFFEEMRYWLAAVFCDQAEGFRDDLLRVLREQNASLHELHAEFVRRLGKPY